MVTVPALVTPVPPPIKAPGPPLAGAARMEVAPVVVDRGRRDTAETNDKRDRCSDTAPVEEARGVPAEGVVAGSPQQPAPETGTQGPAEPRSPLDLVEPVRKVTNRKGAEVVLRRLPPEERDRYRRRMNLAFAVIGMVVLAIALVVLLRLRP
jgi:hypothetical protein